MANGKTVTVSGLALAGRDAANYTLTQPTTTANITPAGLTVTSITANNKVYDSTTAATLTGTPTLVWRDQRGRRDAGRDTLASFADKNGRQ